MKIRSASVPGRGFGLLNAGTLCWSPDDPPAPAPAPGTPPPPVPGGQPFAVFNTKEAFEARRDQEARAILREKYGLTEKQLDERLARAKELEDAESARLKAQQTKEQQLEGEKQAAETKQREAEAARDAALKQAEVTSMCARLGFKNLDYALFEAERSKKTGAELETHFVEMAKDNGKKAALGLATPAPELVPIGGNTAPQVPSGGAPPPPPAPGGPAPGAGPDVMAMTPQQFQQHLQSKHGA